MIQIRTGQVIGRDHMARNANGQDAMAVRTVGTWTVGVVCDGCGSGAYAEVGARLAAQYLADTAARLLAVEGNPACLPDMLYRDLIRFLRGLVAFAAPIHPPRYVQDNLLFTVVGVIASADGGVIFSAGDGLVVIDSMFEEIDQNNRPAYPAYHLVSNLLEDKEPLPTTFTTYQVPSDWNRLAVATDGFEVALMSDVWGIAHPRGLQRRMNVWSDKERRFHDDATIIALERLPEPEMDNDAPHETEDEA